MHDESLGSQPPWSGLWCLSPFSRPPPPGPAVSRSRRAAFLVVSCRRPFAGPGTSREPIRAHTGLALFRRPVTKTACASNDDSGLPWHLNYTCMKQDTRCLACAPWDSEYRERKTERNRVAQWLQFLNLCVPVCRIFNLKLDYFCASGEVVY